MRKYTAWSSRTNLVYKRGFIKSDSDGAIKRERKMLHYLKPEGKKTNLKEMKF